MPKRTRRPPLVSAAASSSSTKTHTPQATRTIIRKFHTLKKQESHFASQNDFVQLARVKDEIDKLGGLEAYQNMSSVGQGNDRGGGTEKVLIEWLDELNPFSSLGKGKGKEKKIELLEVGALKPDNYDRWSYISNTPMDLRSRHPRIEEADFLQLDIPSNANKWDIISLSLVVNFVPDLRDRGLSLFEYKKPKPTDQRTWKTPGRMLLLARKFLRSPAPSISTTTSTDGGLLFLVLPLPCVLNSRYMDLPRLHLILQHCGFIVIRERYKPTGKLIYMLCQAVNHPASEANRLEKESDPGLRTKQTVREGAKRNNFAILLPSI